MLSNNFEAPAIGFNNIKWTIPTHYVHCFNERTFIIDYVEFDTSVSMFMGQILGRMITKYSFSTIDRLLGGYKLSRFVHDLCLEIKDEKIKAILVREFLEFLSSEYPNIAKILGTNKSKEQTDYFKLFYEICLFNDFLIEKTAVSEDTKETFKQFVIDYTGAEYFDKKYDECAKEEERKKSYGYGYNNYSSSYNNYSSYGSSYNNYSYKQPKIEPFVPVGSAKEKNVIIEATKFLCDYWPNLWTNYEDIINSDAYKHPYGQYNSYGSSYGSYSNNYGNYNSNNSYKNSYSTRLANNVADTDVATVDNSVHSVQYVPTNTAPAMRKKDKKQKVSYGPQNTYQPTMYYSKQTVPYSSTNIDRAVDDKAEGKVIRYIGNNDYSNNYNSGHNKRTKKYDDIPRGG